MFHGWTGAESRFSFHFVSFLVLSSLAWGQPAYGANCDYESLAFRAGRAVRQWVTRKNEVHQATNTIIAEGENALPLQWQLNSRPAETPMGVQFPRGKNATNSTIPEVFLEQAKNDPHRVLIMDETKGPVTNRDIVSAVYFLRPEIQRRVEEDVVGVMLPSSVGATLTTLSTQFANKIPAMVNWTVGERNMRLALDNLGVKKILTSRLFYREAKKQFPYLEQFSDRFVFLEDFRKDPEVKIPGMKHKIKLPLFKAKQLIAGVKGRYLPWTGLKNAPIQDTAVVLFTSGSSGIPKAVPLSHTNQLSNVDALVSMVPPQEGDRLIAVLPPFHSFGATGNVALPLVTGLKAAYYPNPLKGRDVAEAVEKYKGTVILGTPTFLQLMARGSKEGQLDTLRFAIHGAEALTDKAEQAIREKTPENFAMVAAYGTTEAAPAVTVNRLDHQVPGSVGWILPNMEYRIVDGEKEGFTNLTPGQSGRLLIRGPNLMKGYLNYDGESPFVNHEGKDWYDTGDIFVEDPASGALSILGRASLDFVKIGGEMVSFNAITDVLHEAKGADNGTEFIVMADKSGPKPRLVLFTTQSEFTDLKEANQIITGAGLTNLYSVDRLVNLSEFPLLGTGKINKKALSDLAQESGK